MSVCISRHGEFGSHELDDAYTCALCGVLDEDALTAELAGLRADKAELERQRDEVLALCDRAEERLAPCDFRDGGWDKVRAIYGREAQR